MLYSRTHTFLFRIALLLRESLQPCLSNYLTRVAPAVHPICAKYCRKFCFMLLGPDVLYYVQYEVTNDIMMCRVLTVGVGKGKAVRVRNKSEPQHGWQRM